MVIRTCLITSEAAEVEIRLLSEEEFARTFSSPMKRVGSDEDPPIDFWPYFEAIPAGHFQEHDCSFGRVECVYQDNSAVYEHVLVVSETKNVFMVIVIDRTLLQVHGHHLLNLNRKYGLEEGNE